jgi:TetR/AcrR family transcriptional regulator, cholesterol catabolism regulator
VASQSAERILEAATRLFGERGYPSTSMRDIGDAVGLLAGSLYSHISSKEAVLLQIVETGLDRYLAAVLPIADSDAPSDVRMRQAVKAHVELVAHHVEESLVALHQWKFLSGENRGRIEAKRHTGSDAFGRILAEGIESGIFKPVPNRDIAVAGILGTLNGVPEWYSPKGPATPEEIGDQLADLLLGGLLAPTRPARGAARSRSTAKATKAARR